MSIDRLTTELLSSPEIDTKVRRVAARLRRHPELRDLDAEDLAQDLRLALVRRAPRFSSERGSMLAFATVVIASAAATIVRAARRIKRDRTGTVSLGENAGRLASPTDSVRSCGPAAAIDQRLDVQEALADLPERDRQACEWLKEHSASEVRTRMGVGRREWDRLVNRVAAALAARDGIASDPRARGSGNGVVHGGGPSPGDGT